MNITMQRRDVYEDFNPEADAIFFKLGSHGLISFHGRHYHIKKRLSAEERNRLLADSRTFFKVSSDCYVNVKSIASIGQDFLLFDDSAKRLPCPKRKQQLLAGMLNREP
jgi:hypothetical protein